MSVPLKASDSGPATHHLTIPGNYDPNESGFAGAALPSTTGSNFGTSSRFSASKLAEGVPGPGQYGASDTILHRTFNVTVGDGYKHHSP